MKSYKKHITLFFLIFFISTKLFSLHVLNHEGEDQIGECDVCEFVINSNTTPFVAYEQAQVEQLVQYTYNKQKFYEYTYQFVQNQIDNALFSRPPPAV